MKNLQKFSILALIFIFSASLTILAAASTRITSVSISLQESKSDPGIIYPVEVTNTSTTYHVEDVSISKDYDSWKPGKKVTYSIRIIPEDGYTFSKKDTYIYALNGEITSKTISSNSIELKVNYIPKVTLEDPSNIYFEDEYMMIWDKVPYATAYEVTIYKDDSFYKTVKVTTNQIDLSPYATDEAELTFTIRATANAWEQSSFLRSSNIVNFDDSVSASDNTSYGNFSGTWPDMRFRCTDGSYATDWQFLNGYWYYFKPENQMAACREWLMINNRWYYFNEFGIMQTGWLQLNTTWYYLNLDGSMYTGWLNISPAGIWYYLDPTTGAMLSNTVTPDGYYVDSSGVWYVN